MRTSLRSILFVSFTLVLTACAQINQSGSSTSKGTIVQHGSGLPAAIVSQSSIQGNWKASCTQDPATKGYYTAALAIQNTVMAVDTISYADSNCAFAISDEKRVSNIVITALSDVTNLTETLVTIQYTPMNAVMANLFNSSSFCGVTNWAANTPEMITTATACAGVQPKIEFHTELYGSQELYLDTCAITSSTTTCAVRYVKSN